MRKLTILSNILLIIAIILFGGCGGGEKATAPPETPPLTALTSTPTPTPSPSPTPSLTTTPPPPTTRPTPRTTVATPASLQITSVEVLPIVVAPEQPVNITVTEENTGGTAGTDELVLTVNGAQVETKNISVEPKGSNTVTFTAVFDTSGLYEIGAGGTVETIRVKNPGDFPRLVNYYVAWYGKAASSSFLWSPAEKPSRQMKALALYDIICIPYDIPFSAPDSIPQLRQLNPNIKILALFWTGESGTGEIVAEQALHEDWFLHYGNTSGTSTPPDQRRVPFMEAFWVMNPTSGWATFAPEYIHDKIMATGLFDGVFLDMIDEWGDGAFNPDISNIDIDNDGAGDDPATVKQLYDAGMTQLLKNIRDLCGPEAIIVGNCEWGSSSPYFLYANGNAQESALGIMPLGNNNFTDVWDAYQINMQQTSPPPRIHFIMADTSVTFQPPVIPPADDFSANLTASEAKKMRYGLGITLLDDGYFAFDAGVPLHYQVWWFSEYDSFLGQAVDDAVQRSDGVWIRAFENGVVFVNPTASVKPIFFKENHKNITTGEINTVFQIQPYDSIILINI